MEVVIIQPDLKWLPEEDCVFEYTLKDEASGYSLHMKLQWGRNNIDGNPLPTYLATV